MAVPFDRLLACSAARTVAIHGLVSMRPVLSAAQTGPGGVPLGDVLRVQLSGSGAGAKLVCILEGSRRCASWLHQRRCCCQVAVLSCMQRRSNLVLCLHKRHLERYSRGSCRGALMSKVCSACGHRPKCDIHYHAARRLQTMLDDAPPLPLRLTATFCRQPQQQQGREAFFYSTTFTAFSLDHVDEQPLQPWAHTGQQAAAGASASLAGAGATQQRQHTQPFAQEPVSQATMVYHTHPVSQVPSQTGPVRQAGSAGILPPPNRQSSVQQQALPLSASQSGAARTAQETVEVCVCGLALACCHVDLSLKPCRVKSPRFASQWMQHMKRELRKHGIDIKDKVINPLLKHCLKEGMPVVTATAIIVARHKD